MGGVVCVQMHRYERDDRQGVCRGCMMYLDRGPVPRALVLSSCLLPACGGTGGTCWSGSAGWRRHTCSRWRRPAWPSCAPSPSPLCVGDQRLRCDSRRVRVFRRPRSAVIYLRRSMDVRGEGLSKIICVWGGVGRSTAPSIEARMDGATKEIIRQQPSDIPSLSGLGLTCQMSRCLDMSCHDIDMLTLKCLCQG